MDDKSFRKMAEEVKRPPSSAVSVFRGTMTPAQMPAVVAAGAPAPASTALNLAQPNPERVWESLSTVTLDAAALIGKGLFANTQQSNATDYFDILRTRLLHAMQERGWKRIAVTSPTHGCGKTYIAANLAFSLARRPSSKTVLLDMELRNPGLAKLFGLTDAGTIRDFLNGDQPLESHFKRVGRTLALGLNDTAQTDAAEVLHEPSTATSLSAMVAQLDPEMVIIDAPPTLVSDDALALLPMVDAVLLVVDGTKTTAEDVRACERLFADHCPLMGVVLNRAQDRSLRRYQNNKS
ncbi:CpsD/CapB family tyrosine-protein kinase [Pseudorhodobacter sp. W20_MBD10_FR17]|uniref:CpsD/CapB family tyrosine-protein kinase n=1 Tax=Pseudorhodobacter sp. W20_MBD10_FR17 TaxID=3240266 RepID=UPI003F953F95